MKSTFRSLILIAFFAILTLKLDAQVSVGLSVRIGPPAIPVYEQPICPADGYIWTPGYWAYDNADGYYWVPGVWVAPPTYGYYWTPCWWGYDGGAYLFHAGYWGPHVGFYGGINYGFGYGGSGYYGGRWEGNRFAYNTAVSHVNRTIIHNTYVNNNFVRNSSRASFNGRGGITARPTSGELAAARDRHISPTSNQLSHQRAASQNRSQFASANHGRPATTAMDRVNGHAYNQQGHVAQATNRAANAQRATARATNHEAIAQRATARATDREANAQRANARATNREANSERANTRAVNREANVQRSAARANMQQQRSVQQRQVNRASAARPMAPMGPRSMGGGAPHPGGGRPMGGGEGPHPGGGGGGGHRR